MLTAEVVASLREARGALADIRLHVATMRLARAVELRYRPDQPRAPRGTPIGGQWVSDFVGVVRKIERLHAAEVDPESIARDLVTLGGGVPRLQPTPKGARQFIFPNGLVLRFDLLPGQYLPGQTPHINIQVPGVRDSLHLNLK